MSFIQYWLILWIILKQQHHRCYELTLFNLEIHHALVVLCNSSYHRHTISMFLGIILCSLKAWILFNYYHRFLSPLCFSGEINDKNIWKINKCVYIFFDFYSFWKIWNHAENPFHLRYLLLINSLFRQEKICNFKYLFILYSILIILKT